MDMTLASKGQRMLMAERAAVVDAQRNLLEIAKGVKVNGETEVEDFMLKSDVVMTHVNGIVKGAEQVGETNYDSTMGIVSVELEMPLYGGNGLSDAILPETVPAATQPPALSPDAVKLLSKYSGIVIEGAGSNGQPALSPAL